MSKYLVTIMPFNNAKLNYVLLNLKERSNFFAKSIVRSEKSYSRALTQFRVILLDDLAVIWRRNRATLTVRHAVSHGTYRTKRALNVADIFPCTERTPQGKDCINSDFRNEN